MKNDVHHIFNEHDVLHKAAELYVRVLSNQEILSASVNEVLEAHRRCDLNAHEITEEIAKACIDRVVTFADVANLWYAKRHESGLP